MAVGSPSGGAHPTAGRARPHTPEPITPAAARERAQIQAMLAIPRPKTRGECLAEARPCPWVGCRHHLLIEVAAARTRRTRSRSPGLILNVPTTGGQRPQLRPSCDDDTLQAWIEDVVDALAAMPWSCSLDVVDALEQLTLDEVGEQLGLGDNRVRNVSASALRRWAFGLVCEVARDKGEEPPDDGGDALPSIKHLARMLRAAMES